MNSSNIFNELYCLLDEYNIDSITKFQRKSSPIKREISTLIIIFYKNNLRHIINMLNRSQGIVFNFERFNAKWHTYEKIAKKSAFYSDISVVLFDGKFTGPSGVIDHDSKYIKRGGSNSTQSVVKVIELLLSIKDLVLKNILIPLPDSIHLDTTLNKYDPMLSLDYEETVKRIKSCDLESTLIPVNLDKWQTQTQLNERETFFKGKRELQPLTIYLPHLSNLTTESLIGIREDNFDHFYNFQQGLKDFLNSSSSIKSEDAFIDLARKVDCEVREIEQQIIKVQRQRNQKGLETFFGMGASAVSFLVEPELAKYIGAIFASKTAFDGFSFIQNRDTASDILKHQYYLAYKVKELSLNF